MMLLEWFDFDDQTRMRDKLTQPKSSRVETAVFAMSPVEVRQACRDLGLWVSLGWAGDMDLPSGVRSGVAAWVRLNRETNMDGRWQFQTPTLKQDQGLKWSLVKSR